MSQTKITDVEKLLNDECHNVELKMHPTMIPFLTVMDFKNDKFRPYVAQVNHNTITTSLVVSIASTMLGNYCQDKNADIRYIQEMGYDAGVFFGYYETVRMLTLISWKNIPVLKIFPLTYQCDFEFTSL